MFAARLPAFACGLALVAFTLAHEAAAVEQTPMHANSVLRVSTASNAPSETSMPSRAIQPPAQHEEDGGEEWTEPRRFLLGFAALFIFLAFRRRGIE